MGRSSKPVDRFAYERALLEKGIWPVAGVDEVGRGPLAGPVVAAAVVLPPAWIREGMPAELRGLNDSKQLSATQREAFFERLVGDAGIRVGIGRVDAARIDEINILRATHEAMRLALASLASEVGSPTRAVASESGRSGETTRRPALAVAHVLVDGLPVQAIRQPQTAIVKGDALSYSIAAASVVAKVTRDRLMLAFAVIYPGYGFGQHKGYGTRDHLEAIRRLGPSPIHRRSFAPFRPEELDLFSPGP